MGQSEEAGRVSEKRQWPVALGHLNARPPEQLHLLLPNESVSSFCHFMTSLLHPYVQVVTIEGTTSTRA